MLKGNACGELIISGSDAISVGVKRLKASIIFLFLLLLVSGNLVAQESTLDNYTGNWTINASWSDGTSPGISGINDDVTVYGYITRWGDLDFNNGALTVNDTLVIYGNLSLGNNSNLFLGAGALLIVYGDITSGNQVEVASGGTIIVTGTWTMTGSDNQGSFDNDGALYIFNPGDGLKDGPDYADINCDTCVQDSTDLVNSDLGDFFFNGSFSIEASGPLSFCPGGSVTLSVADTATNYQWYKDGIAIAGETTYFYTATSTGDYDVSFVVNGQTFNLTPVTVAVDTVNPVPDLSSLPDVTDDCAVTSLTAPTATDNCAGTITGTHDASLPITTQGSTLVTWTYDDGNGNIVIQTQTVVIDDNEAPVITGCPANISVSANDEYCGNIVTWSEPTATDNCSTTMTSSHSPGSFFTVGTTTVTYTATDPAGNAATCSFDVTVLPAADPVITGDADVCTPVVSNYSTPLLSGKSYSWNVTGGSITGPGTNNEVAINWTGTGPGEVNITVTSGSGCTVSNTMSITKNATPVLGNINSDNQLSRR